MKHVYSSLSYRIYKSYNFCCKCYDFWWTLTNHIFLLYIHTHISITCMRTYLWKKFMDKVSCFAKIFSIIFCVITTELQAKRNDERIPLLWRVMKRSKRTLLIWSLKRCLVLSSLSPRKVVLELGFLLCDSCVVWKWMIAWNARYD